MPCPPGRPSLVGEGHSTKQCGSQTPILGQWGPQGFKKQSHTDRKINTAPQRGHSTAAWTGYRRGETGREAWGVSGSGRENGHTLVPRPPPPTPAGLAQTPSLGAPCPWLFLRSQSTLRGDSYCLSWEDLEDPRGKMGGWGEAETLPLSRSVLKEPGWFRGLAITGMRVSEILCDFQRPG